MLYDVNNIWSGKRNMFKPSNNQELAAVKLLSQLDLSSNDIRNLIKNDDIDLDVADSRGNTRLMISSVKWFSIRFNIYFD